MKLFPANFIDISWNLLDISCIFFHTLFFELIKQFYRVSCNDFESGKASDMTWQWNVYCATHQGSLMKKRVDIRVNRARSELKFHTIDVDDIVSSSDIARLVRTRHFFPLGVHSISSILLHAVRHAENRENAREK